MPARLATSSRIPRIYSGHAESSVPRGSFTRPHITWGSQAIEGVLFGQKAGEDWSEDRGCRSCEDLGTGVSEAETGCHAKILEADTALKQTVLMEFSRNHRHHHLQ